MDLARRFAASEIDAFEELFRAHQPDVYRWISIWCANPALAEDLTIETSWRIYRARARFDPDRCFGAWARRIAVNLAMGHLRHCHHEVEMRQAALGVTVPSLFFVLAFALYLALHGAFQPVFPIERLLVFPLALAAVYYRAWKYLVHALNRLVGIAPA